MGKIRVHELAKNINMTNQEVIAKLNAKGISVKTHSSSVDEAAAYAALGLSPNETVNKSTKTRTVLRRRVREEATEVVEAPAPVKLEEKPIEKIEKPVIQREKEALEIKPAGPKKEPEEKIIIESPKKEEAKPTDLPPKSPTNVVRVIDAGAIKARLASEGRVFGRKPGGPSKGGLPSGGFNRKDESTQKKDDRPQLGYTPPSQESPTNKPGGRPSKKKQKGQSYTREMKESFSSGRELWKSQKKKKGPQKSAGKSPNITTAAAHKRIVEMTGAITVNDLAHKMAIKAGQVVSKLISMGMMVTVNEAIDFDTASIVASEFGFEVKNVAFEENTLIKEAEDTFESLMLRAPIVTVMGHVDHGKTSLLDALRETSVVKGEAGGITQHIGAYSVKTALGQVTFLDTPGHEAFTSMRARGAQVTDIVVLVVAANDGLMPQTREAIDHAKAANVPVIVAINKMDLPDAKPDKIMQQLSELGLVAEEWGGDTQFIKISALKRTGLNDLMQGILTLAEVMELKANPDKPASGVVIEAKLDKGRGPVATIIIQSGTLKSGDYLVAGESMGRVRAMYDSNGQKIESAGPSLPVQVLGLSTVPTAGDLVNGVQDDKTAKTISSHRAQKNRELEMLMTKNVSLENFLASTPGEEVKTLKLVIKADVYGSAEALAASLVNLSTKEVKVEIVHSGVGTITESNVNLAKASNAIIIGFNIKAEGKAQALAQQEKIEIRYYNIIYEALEDVRKAMAGLLAPIVEERYLGKAEVRAVISVSKHGKIAGSYVLDGKIIRSGKVRIKRKEKEIFVGNITSLKRFKEDVKEVSAGYECGIGIDGVDDIKEGDILECFELKEVEAKLSEALVLEKKVNNPSGDKEALV